MSERALAQLLRQHSESISNRWLERVVERYPEREPALRGHVPSLLRHLALALDTSGSPPTIEDGASPDQRPDLDLQALIQEHGLLRECVLDLLEQHGAVYRPQDVRVLAGAFSEALAVAVSPRAGRIDDGRLSGSEATEAVIARQRAEGLAVEVRRSEAELRLVTDALPVPVSFVRYDERYALVNKAYEDWFGIPREQLIGRELRGVVGEAAYAVLRPYVLRGLSGERFSFEQYDVPYRLGGTRDIRVWFVPHRDASGAVEGYVALLQDISAQRRTEQVVERQSLELSRLLEDAQRAQSKEEAARRALEEALGEADRLNVQLGESELLLRNLVNNLPELAWSATPDGQIDFYSERWFEYTGTTLEEMRGWGWSKVHDPALLPKVTEQWRHSLESGEPFEMEFPLRAADGTFQWFLTRVRPVRDSNGKIVRWIGTNANIHQQREAFKRAEEASRSKDEFLATASHELRTPLNAILGWSHLLRSGELEPSAFTRGLETIERNARAQVQLIEDILDGSRIITGKLHLEIRPLDMTALVRAALDTVRTAAEAKGIELSLELEQAASRIVGDPERLQQVVWNLVNNAVKFTPRGGAVRVELRRSGTSIELSVSDSGQGIAQDFLPYVFERFRQAEGSTTRRHGGLGLGLALVRHLVEAHGGTVSATSEGEGRGSRFSALLPVQAVFQEPADAATARPESVGPTAIDGSKRLDGVNVLLVDDEADARELVATVLRSRGAEVTMAASAEQALTLVAKQMPMVLVSDIGMPQVDGYELMRRVRTSFGAKGAELPAIALTAYSREQDRRLALEAGFQTHVAKPVEPAELVRVVGSLVRFLRRSSPGEREADLGRADSFLKLEKILDEQGLHEALRFLNSRTSHRFTAMYRFDPPLLRNVVLVDSYSPGVRTGDDAPLDHTYCSIVGVTRLGFTTEDTRLDDRLRQHPAREVVLSYCGVLLSDAQGKPFGSLCHFDLVPSDVPVNEISLMEAAAPLLMIALAKEMPRVFESGCDPLESSITTDVV